MKKRIYPTVLFALVIAILLPQSVRAQSACQLIAVLSPLAAYSSINIRSGPVITGKDEPNNVLGQLLRGQTAPADKLEAGFWHLCAGGYVSASVVSYAPSGPTPTRIVITPTLAPMPPATLTLSPSATPTPSPSAATPTAIRPPVLFRVCIQYLEIDKPSEICSVFSEVVGVSISPFAGP